MLKGKSFGFSVDDDTMRAYIKYLRNDKNRNPIYQYDQQSFNVFWKKREYIQYDPEDEKWYFHDKIIDNPRGNKKTPDPFDIVNFSDWPGGMNNDLAWGVKAVFDEMRELCKYVDGNKHPKFMKHLMICNSYSDFPFLPLEILLEIVSHLRVGDIDGEEFYNIGEF